LDVVFFLAMITTPTLNLDEFVEVSGDGRGDQTDELFSDSPGRKASGMERSYSPGFHAPGGVSTKLITERQ
jgi:hypothetical protein